MSRVYKTEFFKIKITVKIRYLNPVFVIDVEDDDAGGNKAQPPLQLLVEQHFITMPSESEPNCPTSHKLLLPNGTQL